MFVTLKVSETEGVPAIVLGDGKVGFRAWITESKDSSDLVFYETLNPKQVGEIFNLEEDSAIPRFGLHFKNKKGLQALIYNLQRLEQQMEGEDARLSDLGEWN